MRAPRDRFGRALGALSVVLAVLALAGCGSSGGSPGLEDPLATGSVAADFVLVDLNPGSATYQAEISPRDQLGRISAWYFDEAVDAAPT